MNNIDKYAVFAAGVHAKRARDARKEVLRLFPFRHFSAYRQWIRTCITVARHHEQEYDAIMSDSPLVVGMDEDDSTALSLVSVGLMALLALSLVV